MFTKTIIGAGMLLAISSYTTYSVSNFLWEHRHKPVMQSVAEYKEVVLPAQPTRRKK